MEWWQWTGLGCLLVMFAIGFGWWALLRSTDTRGTGLDYGRGPNGGPVLLDTQDNWAEFVQRTQQGIELERDFRGPNRLPFNRPPGMTPEEADWGRWWLERLRYYNEDNTENPQRHRDHIIQARRAAGLPELPEQ
ncbi:hypothetical protein L0U85_02085 [Glycomyces sp. L485]|uniref:hypothetical protein n=1 Tax=Glycomyces sp. L485 TaxID=2909235 RepID=UPI001F4AC5C8|nr:hypothetical protein [Glycomyces sp. L485]MCH7229656.1 hypothetical protein [Glycomyces sp. L485]